MNIILLPIAKNLKSFLANKERTTNENRRLGFNLKKKDNTKVQEVPQSQTAALPRYQEEEETDKTKQTVSLYAKCRLRACILPSSNPLPPSAQPIAVFDFQRNQNELNDPKGNKIKYNLYCVRFAAATWHLRHKYKKCLSCH